MTKGKKQEHPFLSSLEDDSSSSHAALLKPVEPTAASHIIVMTDERRHFESLIFEHMREISTSSLGGAFLNPKLRNETMGFAAPP